MEIKKLSAEEIRDLMNKLYITKIIDVKNYGSIIEDLIKIIDRYPRINWETKKEASYWYEKIHKLSAYQDYLEGKKAIPIKEGRIKFKLKKKHKGKSY